MTQFKSDELLLAWIAGFFDGEGSVIIELSKSPRSSRGQRTRLLVTLTQTSTPCLEIVKKRFGGTIKTSSYKGENARRWAIQHTWAVDAAEAFNFLYSIEPYSIVKKEQIKLAVMYPMFDKKGKKYGSPTRPIPDDVWNKRLKIRLGLQNIRARMKTAATVRYDV